MIHFRAKNTLKNNHNHTPQRVHNHQETKEQQWTKFKKERKKEEFNASEIEYVSYGGEHHLPLIMNLVDQELSEPYSIFTYRYFVYFWAQLAFLLSVILFFFYVVGIFFLCCNCVFVGGFSISGISQRQMCKDCCL